MAKTARRRPPAAAATSPRTVCGVEARPKLLEGAVTAVHDGDTLTLSVAGTAYKIRLDSIDAPELAQPLGSLSQATLAQVTASGSKNYSGC